MSETLRQKIEGLKEPKRYDYPVFNNIMMIGGNQAIDKVLAILDKVMQEKDLPDSAGVWIKFTNLVDGRRIYSLWDITHNGIDYFSRSPNEYDGVWNRVEKRLGVTWIKVIMLSN